MHLADDEKLDEAIYLWYVQERSQGIPIFTSNFMVTILRHPLKLALTGSGGFYQQHGIRQLSLQGEKLSSDLDAPDPFKEKLLKLIEDKDFTLELLYDCDETGLYYRMLPEKTLAARTEKGSSRNEEAKGVYNPHGLLQCYWYIQAPQSRHCCCLTMPLLIPMKVSC